MIEVVGFCVLCFVIVDTFWLICCVWVWIILMGSVRVLVSLCSHGGACEVCQHSGLSYAVRTSLQAYGTWMLAKVVVTLWGRVRYLAR